MFIPSCCFPQFWTHPYLHYWEWFLTTKALGKSFKEGDHMSPPPLCPHIPYSCHFHPPKLQRSPRSQKNTVWDVAPELLHFTEPQFPHLWKEQSHLLWDSDRQEKQQICPTSIKGSSGSLQVALNTIRIFTADWFWEDVIKQGLPEPFLLDQTKVFMFVGVMV